MLTAVDWHRIMVNAGATFRATCEQWRLPLKVDADRKLERIAKQAPQSKATTSRTAPDTFLLFDGSSKLTGGFAEFRI